MKYLLLSFSVLFFCTCSQTPKEAGAVQKSGKYLSFKYSAKTSSMDVKDPANWCAAQFGEAAMISADPKNFYRRLIAISNIPTRIMVDLGHQAAMFMVYNTGDQVEILTSDNLPACLSNKANFQLAPDGLSFQYNNKMDIQFSVYLQELPNGAQIAIDLPPGGGHGLAAVRCETCK